MSESKLPKSDPALETGQLIAVGTFHLDSRHINISARQRAAQTPDDFIPLLRSDLSFDDPEWLPAAIHRLTDKANGGIVRLYFCGTTVRLFLKPTLGMDDFSSPLEATFSRLLDHVDVTPEAWDTKAAPLSLPRSSFWEHHQQHDLGSLAEIYRNLPSPSSHLDLTGRIVKNQLGGWAPDLYGLRSELFPYQLRSLYTMQCREIFPSAIRSTQQVVVRSPLGYHYLMGRSLLHVCKSEHVNPRYGIRNLQVYPGGPFRSDIRGGILCEEMGVGKTIICLSLVISTLGRVPSLPDNPLATGLTSQVAERSFPQPKYHGVDPIKVQTLHSLFALSYQDEGIELTGSTPTTTGSVQANTHSPCPRPVLPRLTELAANCARLSKNLETQDTANLSSQMIQLLDEAQPYFYLFPPQPERMPRVPVPRHGLRVYLGPTLVIVPATLVEQWHREIEKHCPGALRVLELESASSHLPSPREVANNYDLILLSHDRFGREAEDGLLMPVFPGIPRKCDCPYKGATRIRDCRCPTRLEDSNSSPKCSPLMQVHWKRLMIDEGHTIGHSASRMVDLATQLSVESRWIISGTPTQTMVGSALQAIDTCRQSDIRLSDSDESTSLRANATEQDESSMGSSSRSWSMAEQVDLKRLKGMICTFLKFPHQNWRDTIVSPLKGRKDALWMGKERLRAILSLVMVRNQAQDIERDQNLPPLRYKVVMLEFNPIERQTHNALQALMLSNKVLSQGRDQDYIFHQSKSDKRKEAMRNLELACFHFAGPQFLYWVRYGHKIAIKELDKSLDDNPLGEYKWKGTDRFQLIQARNHLADALEDDLWIRSINLSDVLYRLEGLNDRVADAWRRLAQSFDASCSLSGEEIRRIKESVPRLIRSHRNAETGEIVLDQEDFVEEMITLGTKDLHYWLAQQMAEPMHETSLDQDSEDEGRGAAHQSLQALSRAGPAPNQSQFALLSSATNASLSPRKRKRRRSGASGEMEQEDPPGNGRKRRLAEDVDGRDEDELAESRIALPQQYDLLANAQVLSTTSTKLSAILQEVLQHSATEKMLIFSSINNVLYELSLALELLNVRHLVYAKGAGLTQNVRNEYLHRFTTQQEDRVLLMATDLGGRGLDLHVASRVILCEPIWTRDLEMQAIKRAWRLGQTRPVTVKTFVMQGTFEEYAVTGASVQGHQTARDSGLLSYVRDPHFLRGPRTDHPSRWRDIPPSRLFTVEQEGSVATERGERQGS